MISSQPLFDKWIQFIAGYSSSSLKSYSSYRSSGRLSFPYLMKSNAITAANPEMLMLYLLRTALSLRTLSATSSFCAGVKGSSFSPCFRLK